MTSLIYVLLFLIYNSTCLSTASIFNDRCDQSNCWITTNQRVDQPEFPCLIEKNSWCEFYNEDFQGGRIPPNGTKFEILEVYEDSNHGCVTRPSLKISLPPDPSSITGLGLQVQFTSGPNVNRKECLLLNFTTPLDSVTLPTDLHIDLPCFETISAHTQYEVTLRTYPYADTQDGPFQYRERFRAKELALNPNNPNECILYVAPDPDTTPSSTPSPIATRTAPSPTPQELPSKDGKNSGGETVLIVVVVLAVGIVVLLSIAVAGAFIARKFSSSSSNLTDSDPSMMDGATICTRNHRNTSASQICTCTVCHTTNPSPVNSVTSRSTILKHPGSTTGMKSEKGGFTNIYAYNGESSPFDSGQGDSISC